MKGFKTASLIIVFSILLSFNTVSVVYSAKARPDLLIQSISGLPESIARSGSFSVTDTVANNGNKKAGAFIIRYYLSLDTIKSKSDILLVGKRRVTILNYQDTSSDTVNLTVPKKTPLNQYYLIACADDKKKIRESNETNNCTASQTMTNVSTSSGGPTPVATPVGTPDGNAATATIGPAGGTLSSPDSKLALSIPAGALTSDTVITIQPITNNAHGGIGKGYRLTPDGQVFQQPVSLTFTYTDQGLSGAVADALGVAYQSSDGYWYWMANPVVDKTAKTVTATTTHFTDYVNVAGYNLRPGATNVKVGQTVRLKLLNCYLEDDGSGLYSVGLRCDDTSASGVAPTHYRVSEWAVNGVAGGNSTVGTISGDSTSATYTAPASKPTPNTVAVSARITDGTAYVDTLVSNITIVGGYTGTVQFTWSANGGFSASGTANVTWTQSSTVQNVRQYQASGTINADVTVPGCGTKHDSGPIANGILQLNYSDINATIPVDYFFNFASGTVQVACTSGPPANVQIVVAIGCPDGTPTPALTDETTLSGSYSCGVINLINASWKFTAQ
ncbi:MAG: hypothetical protein HZB30_05785 [Nitrospirae bacterium]|nr:hypothetical protein [Nitrospirota bacterium]